MPIPIRNWRGLDAQARAAALARPAHGVDASLAATVAEICEAVRRRGDTAVAEFTERFDGASPAALRVSEQELREAESALPPSAGAAMRLAIDNVRRFHERQLPVEYAVETLPGVRCEQVARPIDNVGLYVPAGTAPLPSAAIMLAVPATLAGCRHRILCTPPRRDGSADPAVLTAARLAGVDEIYRIGGAQAIAAMAWGTESVPKVDKIFGPGNAWVTAAKTAMAADPAGPAIDMPAGPSEVLVIADEQANPEFVAADLLSQAEHDADSQVVLLATSADVAERIARHVEEQMTGLARREIVAAAIANSRFIVVDGLAEAVEVSNEYAPEHLILQVAEPRSLLPLVRNAGSVFLGPWSPEAVGDYCSGTNHVLPTAGNARAFSGLSVEAFMRRMTVQELSRDGLHALSSATVELAELEGLDAHAAAVTRRLGSTADHATATEDGPQAGAPTPAGPRAGNGGGVATQASFPVRANATPPAVPARGTTSSNRAAPSDTPVDLAGPGRRPGTSAEGIRSLARPEISALHAYTAARQEPDTVRLNANEAPRPLGSGTALNRYPAIRPARLQERLAAHYGVPPDHLLVTRGSSEAVDLLIRAFCRAGRDSIVIAPPTFGMYRVYADIQGARTLSVPLAAERDFAFDADAVLRSCTDDTKLIFVCSPNNPTGGTVPLDVIRAIAGARAGRSLVVVDEAYAEFTNEPSAVADVEHRENVVVLRTLSKALSLAGARCGAVIGAVEAISMLNAILAPYALSTPVVDSVLEALSPDNLREAAEAVAETVRERERVRAALAGSPDVLEVWPSEANFLLVRFRDTGAMRSTLAGARILVRELDGDAALEGCVRITVGTRRENDLLLGALARSGEAVR